MTAIPLEDAYLCQDCDRVVDCSTQCVCGSKALLCLAAVLNRETEPLDEEVTA